MSQRHTLSYLIRRFSNAGLKPDTRKGQNFLIDQNLLGILAEEAELSDRDVVLEVGTGTGALTALLAQRTCHVITVEVDLQVQQLAREELIDFPNVTLLGIDVLKNKNRIQPAVLEAVTETLSTHPESVFKLVANLPYHIATPLLSNLLLVPRPPTLMVVTIQKELADRMSASPRTKDYSALSVWMQTFCDVEVLRVLAPSVFWPRPKVHSAIIRVRPRMERLATFPKLREYNQFVRAVFLLRRKYLRSVLVSVLKHDLDKSQIDTVLQEMDLGPQVRAEELGIAQWEQLFHNLWQRMAASEGSSLPGSG